jgi:hypothetical protein
MRKRDQEHYEIARKFGAGRPFTRSEFNRLYYEEYPNRVSGPIPSDYCINLSPKLAEVCPKFLRWLGRGRYEFVGALAEPYRTGANDVVPGSGAGPADASTVLTATSSVPR